MYNAERFLQTTRQKLSENALNIPQEQSTYFLKLNFKDGTADNLTRMDPPG